ncbi:YhgE/Pip domain-containing protein [Bacillus smithii]|uniref:YhgE/Pip domain-containing protein n=2 Tax=Bacillus TaxID=1386 RepID=UPI002E1B8EE4|nr:ABC transporter permease [Bacillus smithii]MED1457212.1 ABC transporter permease [Bacillus smithii]
MKTLKGFFKHSETIIGILTAFVFLLIFFCVWMTAYDGVTDRVHQLKVGLVNQDDQLGLTMEKTLIENLPFKTKVYHSVDSAKKEMNKRKLDMVIQIPENFTSQLQKNDETEIKYLINQANSSLAKQIMDGTSKDITEKMNEKIYTYKQKVIVSNLSNQIKNEIPSKEVAQHLSSNISEVFQSLKVHSVQASIEKVNNVKGFAVTMVPLLVVLSSWVGAMIMSLNLHIVAKKLKNSYSKWSIFLTRQVINIGASILLAVITLLFLNIFNIHLNEIIFKASIFQILVFFSFLSFTQMFVVLFGFAGMVFNILSLSLQLVTFGVIVPKEMLSNFYQTIGSFLPASYVANGYYTLTFGGESLSTDMMPLLLVSVITLFVSVVKVLFQQNSVLESIEGRGKGIV